MRVLDLSHPLAPGMPVHPGDPLLRIREVATRAREGYALREITMGSHAGTHVDAPSHMIPGGAALDAFPPGAFIGRAAVLPLPAGCAAIGSELLEPRRRDLEGCAYALLRTGWSRHWGSPAYEQGYPALTALGAEWLAGFGLAGVGVDAPSLDAAQSRDFPAHRALLGRGLLILENLAGLERLPAHGFTLACFPLSLAGADGSPVRAVALLDE